MNSVISNAKKLKKYISSAKNGGMKLLNPDINESMPTFSIVSNGVIRTGLVGLRNVGKSSEPIIAERTANGKFKSYEDFIVRLMPEKRSYESLVYSGALDQFEGTRRAKIQAIDAINEFKSAMTKHKGMWFSIPEVNEWYKSFFSIEVPSVSEMDDEDKLEKEYFYAGMYVSAHPLDSYAMVTASFDHFDISDLTEDDESEENTAKVEDEKPVTVVGVVKDLEQKLTKKGDTMYVFRLEDTTGDIRTTMFPREVEEFADVVHENAVVRIDGTWKSNDFGVQVVVGSVVAMADIEAPKPEKYVLEANIENVKDIIAVLDKYADNSDDGIKVIISVDGREYAVRQEADENGRRAIPVGKLNESDATIKVAASFEAFCAIRQVAKMN